MLGGRIDGAMLKAAGTVGPCLEPDGSYLSESREGQRVGHLAKIGIATPPTLPVPADRSPINDDSKACGGCQLDVAPLA
jgi:hypothetical protein